LLSPIRLEIWTIAVSVRLLGFWRSQSFDGAISERSYSPIQRAIAFFAMAKVGAIAVL
jgi:hypothetical protein